MTVREYVRWCEHLAFKQALPPVGQVRLARLREAVQEGEMAACAVSELRGWFQQAGEAIHWTDQDQEC